MATAQIGNVELYHEVQGHGEPVMLVPPSWWPAATWNIGVEGIGEHPANKGREQSPQVSYGPRDASGQTRWTHISGHL